MKLYQDMFGCEPSHQPSLIGASLWDAASFHFLSECEKCYFVQVQQANCYVQAGVNRYFTLCSTEFLALGGGGHFALYLDGDL